MAEISTRSSRILDVYRRYHRPLMDREIMDELGFKEPNAVRPRITEHIHHGRLIQTGKAKSSLTGKMVRLVTIPERRSQGTFEGMN